jgi:murein DD-endopeptidase MepM/ murein hydrolase activator NlpD
MNMRVLLKYFFGLIVVSVLVLSYFYLPAWMATTQKASRLRQWITDPAAHPDLAITAGKRCGDAPFLLPTDGYIGFGYGDSFRPGHTHQGLDIFGPTDLNQTPVVAAYDGYLTRESDWKSSVIIRHPQDPRDPSRQIWTYYTHMADPEGSSFILPDFPPGTRDLFVRAGTLLGYQGTYSGDSANPVGMHLHFSVVQSNESGRYKNELDIANTQDPIPYLGLTEKDGVWKCS